MVYKKFLIFCTILTREEYEPHDEEDCGVEDPEEDFGAAVLHKLRHGDLDHRPFEIARLFL